FVALITLVGSVLLVSRKLNSDRPISVGSVPINPKGDQMVEARLWEDPFKWKRDDAGTNLSELQSQIVSHCNAGFPLVLAVMAQGGAYGEDRETRIRSRFAVVSALGESGYAPENSEHIGALLMPWPQASDFRKGWLYGTNSRVEITPPATNSATKEAAGSAKKGEFLCTDTMALSFEWYRRRTFQPESGRANPPFALVLWLDEDRFDEHPRECLALLFKTLLGDKAVSNLVQQIALIGPRNSSTLREFLAPYEAGERSPSLS